LTTAGKIAAVFDFTITFSALVLQEQATDGLSRLTICPPLSRPHNEQVAVSYRAPDDGGAGAAAGRPLKSGSDFSTDFTIPHPSGMPTTSHAMQSIGRFDWPDCREGSPGAGW